MKRIRRCRRRFILSLLAVSVFVPIFLLSGRHLHLSDVSIANIEDLSTLKHRKDVLNLRTTTRQEEGKGINEPPSLVYKANTSYFGVNSSDDTMKPDEPSNVGDIVKVSENNGNTRDAIVDHQFRRPENSASASGKKEVGRTKMVQHAGYNRSERATDEKLKEVKDQAIRAKAYLNFALSDSNSHLVKELKLRIKELEYAIGDSSKDADLSKRAFQKSRAMETTLSEASRLYPDCPAMAIKFRVMTDNAEDQVRVLKNEMSFLLQLAGRTTPKGLHCLAMRLTAEYFANQPEDRKLPSLQDLRDPDLYHFAVFSDNVLACAVVVQSTVSTARETERIVFHIVTDSLNLPAISEWFLLNPPGNASIEIQSIDDFNWLPGNYYTTLQMENPLDPRYTSALNHLRFYLPDIYPKLNKILLLDHDVVVQSDLTQVWTIDMKGKVNGAVETCRVGHSSFRRMDTFINFSDPIIAMRFDAKACTWAFGMNIFDLQEWRRRNLTRKYEKYLHMGKKRPLWEAGSLPIGWITFYNQTVALDRRWHVLGLGYESGIRIDEINQAAVIHYDGIMKPWLDIGLDIYKPYWKQHLNYSHPFFQQCNIHE